MRERIVYIDDEPNILKIAKALFEREGYEIEIFESFDAARDFVNNENFDVLFTDLSMPGFSGMDVLKHCKQYSPDLPVVLVTAYGTVDVAVEAIKNGAFDFVTKPFNSAELFLIARKAIENRKRRKKEYDGGFFDASVVGAVPLPCLGDSSIARQLREDVKNLSQSSASVCLFGEEGSGRRVLASEIHRQSNRSPKPILQMNCQGIPWEYQSIELFGVEKGVSTVYPFGRPGRLELAAEGTFILEDVEHLSADTQKTLRTAIEDERFVKVGGWHPIQLSARIISLSAQPVTRLKDWDSILALQLSAFELNTPALRNRFEDLLPIVTYLVQRACQKHGIPEKQISEQFLSKIKEQRWSGNFVELDHWIIQQVHQHVSSPTL